MRLYLSSFRLGRAPEAMTALLRDGGRRVGVILNADDYKSPAERKASGEREFADLRQLGLDGFEIDLRDYFGRPNEVVGALAAADLLYVRGGSGFVLRRAFAHSGADAAVRDLLARDALVYAGYSAGPAMLTPTLRGVTGAIDVPDLVPSGYPRVPPIWDCLGVLPFCIAPHYRSEHPESHEIERTVQYYIDHHLRFVALRDGLALVVDGDRTWVAR